jgi:transposase
VLADFEASARRRAQGRTPPVISPIALDEVRRIDALFEIERGINGLPADRGLPFGRTKPRRWSRRCKRGCASNKATPTSQPYDYMLKRRASFSRFLDDDRVCLTNNGAERALRGLALGRKG